MPLVAAVLPPKEGFGPGRAGAIGMIVRRHARTPGWRSVVFSGRQDTPTFADVDCRQIAPGLWPLGSTNLRYAAAVAAALKRLKPDLIEVHNRPEMALAIADRLPGTPVLGFLHNDPQGMRQATTVAERTALLRRLAGVVVPSDFIRRRLLDGIAAVPRPPLLLPNCIDLSEFPPPRRKERLILFAGRVVRDKAPDAFIAAVAQASPHLPDWHAEIIGADRFSDDSPETPFVRTIRGAAEGAGVRMAGYRSHAGVLDTMSRAAVVVMPSRWDEPFGLVALEAMASRAALICSTRGALPEVAGDAALYADADDIPAIVAAIRALCTDEPRRAALVEAGYARAAQFDIGPVTARLAELRATLCAAGRPD